MSSAASMIVVLCLGLFLTVGDATLQKGSSVRQRRSLMNLSSMVSDVTGRQSSDFVSYGNYCGLGGSGQPVDPIDECCQVHDLCYNLSSKGACRSLGEKGVYQVDYQWSKEKDGLAACDNDQDKCKTTICMCDAMLTNCLKSNLEFYNSQNLHKLSLFELLQEANYVSEK
ncbi:unnamed protein product [Larinioides sclopetarius]|uniref:Phospholipase A2 n=1 Tax=Larinioides sclopetarius TaxID=280406 RepID=A0AAV1ZM92_9ARAC